VPRWPSLIAVVERAEREVVVELGVPLGMLAFGGVIVLRELTVLQLACRGWMEVLACRLESG
jgi:hypothetical protein